MVDLNYRTFRGLSRGRGRGFARAATAALILTAGYCPTIAATSKAASSTGPRSQESPNLDRSGAVQTGVASFYGKAGESGKTAGGATVNPNKLTAASRTLPLGTKAKVINKENGRSAAVTITDRGPYTKNRILDVSSRAAAKLGMTNDGVSKVKVVPFQEPAAGPRSDAAAR